MASPLSSFFADILASSPGVIQASLMQDHARTHQPPPPQPQFSSPPSARPGGCRWDSAASPDDHSRHSRWERPCRWHSSQSSGTERPSSMLQAPKRVLRKVLSTLDDSSGSWSCYDEDTLEVVEESQARTEAAPPQEVVRTTQGLCCKGACGPRSRSLSPPVLEPISLSTVGPAPHSER